MKTDVTLSNPAIRPLIKAENDGNREIIIQYLNAGGEGVDLTDKQKELLKRWEFADDIIRSNTGKISRSEMANVIAVTQKINVSTAKADMTNAEYVFSSSNPFNKKFRIQVRIEFLEKQSRLAAAANDFKAVAAIEKVIATYIDIYPEATIVKPRRQVILNLQQNIVNQYGSKEEQTTEDIDFILDNAVKEIEENGSSKG